MVAMATAERRRPLPLEQEIIYGPIHSRRLGVSLGINLLPLTCKVCSFDCLYCHYGSTDVKAMQPPTSDFPTMHDVLSALEPALLRACRGTFGLDSLTFSGNGEPTLHPYFPEILFEVQRLRDRLCPDAKIALFSNATTVTQPAIRQALSRVEVPMIKLDAGDAEAFCRINRPDPEVDFYALVAHLKAMPNVIIQSVLIDGAVSNSTGAAFDAWVARIAEIQPDAVQIYSTDYPVPEVGIVRVPPYKLRRLAEEAQRRAHLPVQAYWPA